MDEDEINIAPSSMSSLACDDGGVVCRMAMRSSSIELMTMTDNFSAGLTMKVVGVFLLRIDDIETSFYQIDDDGRPFIRLFTKIMIQLLPLL